MLFLFIATFEMHRLFKGLEGRDITATGGVYAGTDFFKFARKFVWGGAFLFVGVLAIPVCYSM